MHRNTPSKRASSDEENILHDDSYTKYEDTTYELEFNPSGVESHDDIKDMHTETRVIFRKYVCCPEVWKGLVLMFFYQFAGYNVVSFYATSILNHPKEAEEELIHPNKTNNFVTNLDDWTVKEK